MAMPSFLQGTMDVPVLGTVPKWAIYGIGGMAVVYVGYRWWQASSTAGEEIEPEAPGFEDEVLPEVENAYPSDGSIGIGGQEPTTDDFGFHGTDNDEWSQYATIQLTQSARWEYTDIISALGNYLSRKPLSTEQVQIVQAAIAVAGYPPQGSYTIKEGGGGADVPVTVAPTGVKAVGRSSTELTVTWTAVPGAEEYRLYRDGVSQNVGHSLDTTAVVGGLEPDETYRIRVAALTGTGKHGPYSGWASGTTKAAKLSAPTNVQARAEPNGIVWVTWNAVPGADRYRVYHNRSAQNVGGSEDTKARVSALKQGQYYTFHVRAFAGNTMGPRSRGDRVKTKKK